MSTAAKLVDVSGRVPLYSIHASEVKSKKIRLKISGGTGIIKEVKTWKIFIRTESPVKKQLQVYSMSY